MQHLLAIYVECVTDCAQGIDIKDHRLDTAFDEHVGCIQRVVGVTVEVAADHDIDFIPARLAECCVTVEVRTVEPDVVGASDSVAGREPDRWISARDGVQGEVAAGVAAEPDHLDLYVLAKR